MSDSREVEGDPLEKEVGVYSSVVDDDEALKILIESLHLGVVLPAVEVAENRSRIGPEEVCDIAYLLQLLSIPL